MENASKALIMAGSVLLAIIILSIGVYLMGTFQNTTDSYMQNLGTTNIVKYNNNFELYANTTRIITAQEIVTLVEFAKKSDMGTKVFVKERLGGHINRTETPFNTNDFLKTNILYEDENKIYNLFKYDNNSIKYDTNGVVSEIKFSYVPEQTK